MKIFHYSFESIQKDSIDPTLRSYIENKIYPIYNHKNVDEGHDLSHIKPVVQTAIEIGSHYNVDMNMVLVIAACHDIGLIKGDREAHHANSAKMVLANKDFKKWFTDEQIKTIAEAVFDHRSSHSAPPRSIYGKIIADADKAYLTLEITIVRAYKYRVANFPDLGEEATYEDVYRHIKNKWGKEGYAKYHLDYTFKMVEREVKRRTRIINNPKQFKQLYESLIAPLRD